VDEERHEDSTRRQLERGRFVLAQMTRILELHEERLRRSAIAVRMGLSRITVWRRMRALEMVDGRRR